MTLDYVVPQIIRAIVKHPRVAYIDGRWGALCAAWKTIPDAVWTKMNVSPAKKVSIGNEAPEEEENEDINQDPS